jgi:hypothetical protein
MARALMPVKTTSAHWLAHPAFADAVEKFLEREGEGIEQYWSTCRTGRPSAGLRERARCGRWRTGWRNPPTAGSRFAGPRCSACKACCTPTPVDGVRPS